MSRVKIAEYISNEIGFSKSDSLEIVEVILDSIMDAVVAGETVKIPHFGSFVANHKKVRSCTSLKTGAKVVIGERKVVSFKASAALRKRINNDSQLV